MKNNSNINKKKVYNYCIECDRKYPTDIQFCPTCRDKLFPVPYEG